MSGMAVFSALEFEKNREKYQVGCIGDVSSFNFIADAASVASPAVVNVVANVYRLFYRYASVKDQKVQ